MLLPITIALALTPVAVPPITAVAEIPAEIRGALHIDMADAGQPYQATDVVIGKPLPWARLVRASHDGTTWTIEYERGGIGYSRHRATVLLIGGKYVVTDEWVKGR